MSKLLNNEQNLPTTCILYIFTPPFLHQGIHFNQISVIKFVVKKTRGMVCIVVALSIYTVKMLLSAQMHSHSFAVGLLTIDRHFL